MTERGTFKSELRGRQLIRFDECQILNTTITPTDIDAIIEYHDKTWIMFEAKMEGVKVNRGQDVLIKRFIQDGFKAGKYNLCMIVEHNKNADEDVYLKDCKVRELYMPSKTGEVIKFPPFADTLMECVNRWIDWIDGRREKPTL